LDVSEWAVSSSRADRDHRPTLINIFEEWVMGLRQYMAQNESTFDELNNASGSIHFGLVDLEIIMSA
jgi:hypothetical protein